MVEEKIITIKGHVDDLTYIERACKIDRRPRSSFLIKAGLEKAEKLIKEEEIENGKHARNGTVSE